MPTIDQDLLARARIAAQSIAPLAASIEEARRLPKAAVSALIEAGVFKLLVPREHGGAQTNISTLLAVIEEIARADGSAGWCAMIGSCSGLMSAWLDPATASSIYGPADSISGGVSAPMGRATKVEGGHRVSGRWPFASGCENTPWLVGGMLIAGPEGQPPAVRFGLFSSDQVRVVDTWNVSGLRGTGSHDIEVTDAFVPDARSFSLFEPPLHRGELYRLPFFGVLAAGVASVSLGIARAAVDAIIALAKNKAPLGSKRGIAHRELVQLRVAQAEAKVRAARAFLHEAVGDVEREVMGEGRASLRGRALLRIAAAHAATESAAAVDLAYETGGATSIYAKHPLQRHFRDVHVATQHIMVSETSTVLAGRILLDVESDTSIL